MIVQEIRNDNVFGYVRYQGEPNRKDAVIEKLRKQGFRITKASRVIGCAICTKSNSCGTRQSTYADTNA